MDNGRKEKPHPLLNHIVLQRMLKMLTLNDLKIARIVCSDWNYYATPIISQKSSIKLKFQNIENFLKDYRKRNNNFSCSHFVLDSWEFDRILHPSILDFLEEIQEDDTREIVFSNCIFRSIKSLHLILESFPFLEFCAFGSPQIVQQEDVELPNAWSHHGVKNLEVTVGSNGVKIGSWSKILQWFPAVSILNAQCRNSNDLQELLDAISESKSSSNFTLTEFSSFLTPFNEIQLLQLLSFGFNFQNLDLNVSPTISRGTFQNLMESCKNSLKILKLFHDLTEGIPKNFPYDVKAFASLTSLELAGDMVLTLNFLDEMPVLLCLIIRQHHDEDDPLYTDIIKSHESSKIHQHAKLTTFTLEYKLRPSCIKLLSEIVPNISSVSLYFDDDSMRAVYESMINVQEILILGNDVTDEGITGIEYEILFEANTIKDKGQSISSFRTFPYISDCKKLKKISLCSLTQENISDYSVIYGFMDVLELTSLDLSETSITSEGINILKTKSNLVKFNANYEDQFLN